MIVKMLGLHAVKRVRVVGAPEFQSSCCFTGLCTPIAAISSAKQSKLNTGFKSNHSCFGRMKEWLKVELQHKAVVDPGRAILTEAKMRNVFAAMGVLMGWVAATMKSGVCAMFCVAKKHTWTRHVWVDWPGRPCDDEEVE